MKLKHVLACLVFGAIFTTSTISLHAATYTIQPGDTLSKISAKTGVSLQKIVDVNGITDANKIIAGNTLTLIDLPTSLTDDITNSLYELFNEEYYADQNPDVVAVYGTSKKALYQHFLQYGMEEGRNISPDFDVNAYRSAYPDLQNAFGDDISKYYEHYFIFGQKENRALVTTKACVASGITVYDFDGKVIAAPVVAAASSNSNDHSDSSSGNDSAEDRYWMTGTWYRVETEVSESGDGIMGLMQSQGHFPYTLYSYTDNGDGTYSFYKPTDHGAWADGTFTHVAFGDEIYHSENYNPAGNPYYAIEDLFTLEKCRPVITSSEIPLGVYDEGCIHLVTLQMTGGSEHEWVLDGVDYTCKNCNAFHPCSYNYPHVDKDGDNYCDICNIYCALHDCIDEDSDGNCDLCGYYHIGHIDTATYHKDQNGVLYCDICYRHEHIDVDGNLQCDVCLINLN